jgi:hypothetical protein
MSKNDKCIIDLFLPLIINKLCSAGFIVEEIKLSELTEYYGSFNYHLKIITSRQVPYNVYIPSFLITPYAQMFESLGLSILIGREAENNPIFNVKEFEYIPSAQYLHSFTSMAAIVKEKVKEMIINITYALKAEELSQERLHTIRGELVERTFKQALTSI